MGNFEDMARRLAEQYVRKGYMDGNAELDEAATRILDATAPPTMADVEWDDEKHYLAGATSEIDDSECVMLAPIDGLIVNAKPGGAHVSLMSPGALTPNGKRYELRELNQPEGAEHPAELSSEGEYAVAPPGTVVAKDLARPWIKANDGIWEAEGLSRSNCGLSETGPRKVLRWGVGRVMEPVNWNEIEDPVDLDVWSRLTGNFWLPEKIPVSNDIPSWGTLTDAERDTTMKVFAGLTLLDTIQGTVGAVRMVPDALTAHEEAVLTNIAFMESGHAKSYSNIFMTLADTATIRGAFRWADHNEYLQVKKERILDNYWGAGGARGLRRKLASTVLESFLFYSGFYWPLYLASRSKLTNTADIIRLIIRDEAVHGYYIGYKYQMGVKCLAANDQERMREHAYEMVYDLYENESDYTDELYGELGLADQVRTFLRYNANKALNNLGYENLFSVADTQVAPEIMAQLSPNADENHDFFSGSGSSYVMGKAEHTTDDDWSF